MYIYKNVVLMPIFLFKTIWSRCSPTIMLLNLRDLFKSSHWHSLHCFCCSIDIISSCAFFKCDHKQNIKLNAILGKPSLKNTIRRGVFSQKLKRPICTVFCWHAFINCATVGHNNLDTLKFKAGIPKHNSCRKITTEVHLRRENYNIFVSQKP